MNISIKTDEEQGVKRITIDLGRLMRRGDLVTYRRAEAEDLLREKFDLDNYTLTEAPQQIGKCIGVYKGDYTFVKNQPVKPATAKKTKTKKASSKTPSSKKKVT